MRAIPLLCLLLGACNAAPPATTAPPQVAMSATAPQVDALNALRRAAGRPAAVRSPRADAAALAHARDMARTGVFAHAGSDGSTHSTRLRRAGCAGGAENLAKGRFDAASVVAAWADSPAHRRNMLLPGVTHYGLAQSGEYWVMTLAAGC